MKHITKSLLAALLITACPVVAQEGVGAAETEESEIEIINGIPVNPELKKLIMASEEQLSVQEIIEMANKVMQEQEDAVAAAAAQADEEWMQNDPLGHLEEEMSDLVGDIDESDTAEQTQAQGEDLVRKMDRLIAVVEQASSASGSGTGSGQGQNQGPGPANGGKPAEDSTLAQGPGGSGDLGASGEGNNRFEDLDPAQREAILRANEENQGIPAEFDALLAEYYQRLAAERALTAEEDEAGDE